MIGTEVTLWRVNPYEVVAWMRDQEIEWELLDYSYDFCLNPLAPSWITLGVSDDAVVAMRLRWT